MARCGCWQTKPKHRCSCRRKPLSHGVLYLEFWWSSGDPHLISRSKPLPFAVTLIQAVLSVPLSRRAGIAAWNGPLPFAVTQSVVVLCVLSVPSACFAFKAVVNPPIVRTLTKFSPLPDFVRTLTTFRPLRGRARRLPFWQCDLRQFCPLKNPSKTEQKRNKTEQNGHQNRKNRSQNSAFCLTYLNIGSQKPPSRARNGVPSQKKRAFRCFGNVKIDVSVMEQAACKAPRRCHRGRPTAICPASRLLRPPRFRRRPAAGLGLQ